MRPSDYGLPHDEWREYQEDAVNWAIGTEDVGICEAPTGSGKSAMAVAVGSQKSMAVLTRTKNLQRQYGDIYDCAVLFGRGNYKCVHPDAPTGATGSDCLHEDNMYRCPVARNCEYLVRKAEAKASPKAAYNYPYFLTAGWIRDDPPQVVVADEAHDLPSIVTQHCGCTITDRDRVEWGLSAFPELRPAGDGGMLTKAVDPVPVALGWLEDARNVLRREWKTLKHATTKSQLTRKRKCERLGRKVGSVLEALRGCADDWYIRSGQRAQKYGREWRPAFVCKPLTARHHYGNYFSNGFANILMSATIGQPGEFAEELGIAEYDFLDVPNQFKSEERPVYVLPNVPSMGARAAPSAFECQADEIASVILDCPPDWSWLILVTRKRESALLGNRLAQRGLQDRIWVPKGADDGSYHPTDEQVKDWNNRLLRKPNSIAITWNFWTGYDGQRERGLILAKTPWPLWGNNGSYEGAWRGYSTRRYNHTTAVKLMQGAGRTRRGELGHYDIDGEFNGFVCVADASWSRLKKYYSSDFLDSVIEI